MITDSKQAWLAKITGRRVQEEILGAGFWGQIIIINYSIPFLLGSFLQPLQNGGKGKSIKIGYNKISEKVQKSVIPHLPAGRQGL